LPAVGKSKIRPIRSLPLRLETAGVPSAAFSPEWPNYCTALQTAAAGQGALRGGSARRAWEHRARLPGKCRAGPGRWAIPCGRSVERGSRTGRAIRGIDDPDLQDFVLARTQPGCLDVEKDRLECRIASQPGRMRCGGRGADRRLVQRPHPIRHRDGGGAVIRCAVVKLMAGGLFHGTCPNQVTPWRGQRRNLAACPAASATAAHLSRSAARRRCRLRRGTLESLFSATGPQVPPLRTPRCFALADPAATRSLRRS
jgi:hypothetical protein